MIFFDSWCQVVDRKERVIAVAIKEGNLDYLSFNQSTQSKARVNIVNESNKCTGACTSVSQLDSD